MQVIFKKLKIISNEVLRGGLCQIGRLFSKRLKNKLIIKKAWKLKYNLEFEFDCFVLFADLICARFEIKGRKSCSSEKTFFHFKNLTY